MRRVVVLLMLGLASCQIIINHNTFEAAPDGGVDGSAEDAPADGIANANAVTSLATTPMMIGGATIGWTTGTNAYLSFQDGHWIESVSSNGERDSARVTFASGTFKSPPRCFCAAAGGNNNDCNLTASPTVTGAELELWNPVGPPRIAYLWCIGEAESGAPGELRWTGSGQAMLASASTGLAGNFQDGGDNAWFDDPAFVIPGSNGNARGFHFTRPFKDVPTCDDTVIVPVDGRFTSQFSMPSGRSWVVPSPSSGTEQGGLGSLPTRFDFMCLGALTESSGSSQVISPSAAGARIATATLRSDGTLESSDGGWVVSSAVDADGLAEMSLKSGAFSIAPRCWCSIESDSVNTGDVCSMTVDPTTTTIKINRYDIEDGDFALPKPQIARRTHVACMQTN